MTLQNKRLQSVESLKMAIRETVDEENNVLEDYLIAYFSNTEGVSPTTIKVYLRQLEILKFITRKNGFINAVGL